MPDAQGNYLGDQATVMPDNTAAFMHYSDQFAQLQQQKNLDKAKEAKLEQERSGRLQTAIHSSIYNPSYLKNDATNPLIRENMDSMAANAKEVYKTKGEAAAMDFINKSAMDLGAGAEKIAQTNKSMTDAIAHYQVLHPEWDGASAMHIAATNSWYKKDKNGNSVHKELSEINPNDDFLGNVRNGEHGADLYSDQASLKGTVAMIDKEKIEDVNRDQSFNDDGTNKVSGYKGKVATRLTDPALVDGKMQDVTRSENYRLPNQKPFFLDNTGKSVQVLPKELHDQFYGSNDEFKAKVDRMVKEELGKPVNLDGKGEMQFGSDSDYAEMLRKKFSYDYLNSQLKNKYSINSVDDSDKEMRKVHADNLADKRFALSEHRSFKQDEKTDALLAKANGTAGQGSGINDFLGSMNDRYGEDLTDVEVTPGKKEVSHLFKPNEPAVAGKVQNMRIIPITADAKDINIISPIVNGRRSIPPKLFNGSDGKPLLREDGSQVAGWEVNPETGNASGKGGAIIDKEATQRNYINHTKKSALSTNSTNTTKEKVVPKSTAKPVKNDPLGIL